MCIETLHRGIERRFGVGTFAYDFENKIATIKMLPGKPFRPQLLKQVLRELNYRLKRLEIAACGRLLPLTTAESALTGIINGSEQKFFLVPGDTEEANTHFSQLRNLAHRKNIAICFRATLFLEIVRGDILTLYITHYERQ